MPYGICTSAVRWMSVAINNDAPGLLLGRRNSVRLLRRTALVRFVWFFFDAIARLTRLRRPQKPVLCSIGSLVPRLLTNISTVIDFTSELTYPRWT